MSEPARRGKGGLRATLGGPRRKAALRAALAAMAAVDRPEAPEVPDTLDVAPPAIEATPVVAPTNPEPTAIVVDPAQPPAVPSSDRKKKCGASPFPGGAALGDFSGGGEPNNRRAVRNETVRAPRKRVNRESHEGPRVSVDPDGTFRPNRPTLGVHPTPEERAALATWLYESAFARGDHAELARRLHEVMEVEAGGDLFYDEGSFFQYRADEGVYRIVRPHEIDMRLVRMAGAPIVKHSSRESTKVIMLSGNDARGVLRYLQSMVADKSMATKKPTRFMDAPFGINCTNGFLKVEDGKVDLYDRSPVHLARHAVPFAYREDAPHPMLDQFFRDVFEDAVEDGDIDNRIALLQEFLGACFFGIATNYQRMLALYGTSGGNGKSQFLQICRSIFPPSAVSSIPMTSWTNKFTAVAMLGKMANFVDEIPVGVRLQDTSIIKVIIDGLPTWVEEKGKQGFNASLRCGQIVNINKMPTSQDVTPSFFRRFLICPFECDLRNSDKREENIGQKIGEREASGILAWAIEGAKRLQIQGRFTESYRGNHIIRNWRANLDPVMRCLTNIPVNTMLTGAELYKLVKDATDTPLTQTAFGRWVATELSNPTDPARLFDRRQSNHVVYTRVRSRYSLTAEPVPLCGTDLLGGPDVIGEDGDTSVVESDDAPPVH